MPPHGAVPPNGALPPGGAAQSHGALPIDGAVRPDGAVPIGEVDVAVVGAGPAGAVAAAALARGGLRTVLIGPLHRAEPDIDVLLWHSARHGLEAVGALAATSTRPIESLDLRVGAGPTRRFGALEAGVCDRRALSTGVRQAAVVAGAVLVDGTVERIDRYDGRHLVEIVADGSARRVCARHVVVATGAGTAPVATQAGGVIHARRITGISSDRPPVLALAAPRSVDPQERPACAWLLPGRVDGTGTVGVSQLGGLHGHVQPCPDELLAEALTLVLGADGSARGCEPVGPTASGTVNCGFEPRRATRNGHLLVGDAAGLVNPFTGEGLGYAIESGLLAAASIIRHTHDPEAAARHYSRRLEAAYVGFFETSRHAARRYHLAWRVLAASAESDHPFFAKARRAILLPEGLARVAPIERSRLATEDVALLDPFLGACDEVVVAAVRQDWPFLARLLLAGDSGRARRLRPAVLFLGGHLASRSVPDVGLAPVAAAVELATLGALAFVGASPEPSDAGRSVDWATAGIVLAGDFLLAQASRLVAESAPEVSWSFADWLAELTTLRAGRLDPGRHVPADALFASLFEFPARIGAVLGGAPADVTQAVREVGHACGRAFLHAEDVLAVRGQPTRLDATLVAMVDSRMSAVADHTDDGPLSGEELACRLRSQPSALAAAIASCRSAEQQAYAATGAVPSRRSRQILQRFAAAVAAPAHVEPSMPTGS